MAICSACCLGTSSAHCDLLIENMSQKHFENIYQSIDCLITVPSYEYEHEEETSNLKEFNPYAAGG